MAEEIKPPERPHPESGSGAGEERTASHSRSLLVRWMSLIATPTPAGSSTAAP